MKRIKQLLRENPDSIILHMTHEKRREGNDFLDIILKNVNTGKKKMVLLEDPFYKLYITKDEDPDKYKDYEHINNLDEIYVRDKFRQWNIARELDLKGFKQAVKDKKMSPDDIYLSKRLYGADKYLTDAVLEEYAAYYTKPTKDGFWVNEFPMIKEFHLGGLDIETDINVSDNPDEQPVIVNTYIDDKSKKVIASCLINENYKGQKEIIDNLEEFKVELHQFLIDHVNKISFGGDIDKENAVKELLLKKIEGFTYNIEFTADEKKVITHPLKSCFNLFNPDFLLIYNATYDVNHLMRRFNVLKDEDEKFDDLFKYNNGEAYAYINTNNVNPDITKKIHYYSFRNPTKIIDQMLLYYQLRKSKNFAKYSLDATANREVGVGKLDYSKICNWIGDFPYVDYKMFLIYNIIDTLSMLFVDYVTNDILAATYKRLKACTEWERISKSMDRTSAVFDFYPSLDGLIKGCNINPLLIGLTQKKLKKMEKNSPGIIKVAEQLKVTAQSDKDKNPYRIEGGLVTSPNLISDDVKNLDIFKIPIKTYAKFSNLIDYDATSMYPSNTEVNNGSRETLVGRIEKIEDNDDPLLARKTALAILNDNFANIGTQLFGIPSLHNIINNYHGINPIKIENENDKYITKDEIVLPEEKEFSKNIQIIKRLWRLGYRTAYDDKDSEAGRPSVNKLFMTSSSDKIEFSYYSSKVTINFTTPSNELMGIEDKGFICGKLNKGTIYNMNEEYKSFLIPKKEKFTTKLQLTGTLTPEQLKGLRSAKFQSYNLKLVDYELFVIDRLIFPLDLSDDIRYEVEDLIEDENLFKLTLICDYDLGIEIRQSIIGYKHNKEGD